MKRYQVTCSVPMRYKYPTSTWHRRRDAEAMVQVEVEDCNQRKKLNRHWTEKDFPIIIIDKESEVN